MSGQGYHCEGYCDSAKTARAYLDDKSGTVKLSVEDAKHAILYHRSDISSRAAAKLLGRMQEKISSLERATQSRSPPAAQAAKTASPAAQVAKPAASVGVPIDPKFLNAGQCCFANIGPDGATYVCADYARFGSNLCPLHARKQQAKAAPQRKMAEEDDESGPIGSALVKK